MFLTETVDDSCNDATRTSEQNEPNIVNSIHFGMPQLESPDNVRTPAGDAGDGDEQNYSWNQAKRIEDGRNREDAQPNLSLQHQDYSSNPSAQP